MNPVNSPRYAEEIQKMIYELAKGNFSYRISLSMDRDGTDIAIPLNLLAEELSRFFIHPGLFGEKDLENPFVFVVDTRYVLCGVNPLFSHLLGRSESELIGQSLEAFLVPSSFKKLQKQLDRFASQETSSSSVKLLLSFRPTPSHYVDGWGYCHVLTGPTERYYFIRGLQLIGRTAASENHSLPTSSFNFDNPSFLQFRSDIEKIRAVHSYVMAHLHESLPSLPALSRLFLLNECKLKRGFKELYQVTIFKLHLEKRLEQALVMIQHTPSSLKVIAKSLGFKSSPHFSKVFKDKYGQSPSYFRK